jgi:hypothetical protein
MFATLSRVTEVLSSKLLTESVQKAPHGYCTKGLGHSYIGISNAAGMSLTIPLI